MDTTTNFIAIYRQGLEQTQNIIRSLCQKHKLNLDFSVAYRRDKNINDLLVLAKLPVLDQNPAPPQQEQLTLMYVNTITHKFSKSRH